MNTMNVGHSWRRLAAGGCLLLALGVVAGCGSNKRAGSPATTAPLRATTTAPRGTSAASTATGSEAQAPSIVYDYASSADCLDQYSGAYGDNRGRDGAALVYAVRVPKDETEESDTGVRLLFYKTAEQAKRHVDDPGFLPAAEKRLIGNVIIDGDAVRHQYAMELVTACLKF